MKLAWLTDIHLNFLEEKMRQRFYQAILKTDPDALLISGDIAEAPSTKNILNEMRHRIQKPIYFVLGNHDYYRGQVTVVREEMTALTHDENLLYWLPAAGMQRLTDHTILVGQDGWADGRLGDYQNSRVILNDSRMIAELFQQSILGKFQLLSKMQQLADFDAFNLQKDLEQAIQKQPKTVIVLTHVPPFKEVCLYRGKVSNDDFLPFYSSKVVGDVLMQVASNHPSITFLVLCGHTHGQAEYHPLTNLTVKVGKAEYYTPSIQEIFTF